MHDPILLFDAFDQSAPGPNKNIVATANGAEATVANRLRPKFGVSALRITVALATASVFNVVVRRASGEQDRVLHLNGGTALDAEEVYTFTMGCSKANYYDFQVETNGVIRLLQVDEIPGGVL